MLANYKKLVSVLCILSLVLIASCTETSNTDQTKNKSPEQNKSPQQEQNLSKAEPTATTAVNQPGLFRTSDLKWAEGDGTFKGVQVAVVSENTTTGTKVMFVKLPAGKNPAPELHSHTGAAHSFVVEGSVTTMVNGKSMTMNAGEYFRSPEGFVHGDSGSTSGATILMITENVAPEKGAVKFETVAAKEGDSKLANVEPSMVTAVNQPALFKVNGLKWAEGDGTFKGVQVSVVSENPATGMKAMFIKLPTSKNAAPELHFHTATAHSFVVEGSVMTMVNGKSMTMKAGEYFRSPERWVHGDSGSTDGAVIFMITENLGTSREAIKFDTVLAKL